MSAAFLIIDGYNLMHAAGLARSSYGPGDLARQRHLLLVKLTELLTMEERQRCTVVFDAIDGPSNVPGRFKHEEMSILFADRGHEADELIETLIRQHSAPRRVIVVSSDHRLQKAISRRRGVAIDSDVFLSRRESAGRKIGRERGKSNPLLDTGKDLEFWLEEFEGVETERLADEANSNPGTPPNEWERQIEELQKRLNDPDDLDRWLDGRKET